MKKTLLLSILSTALSFGQVTDENGISAEGALNTPLSGNIGIGLTPSPGSTYKLEVNGRAKMSNYLLVGDNTAGYIDLETSQVFNLQKMTLFGNNQSMRAALVASQTYTEFTMQNINAQEIFTLNTGDFGADNVFINMPRPDSRIVIAGDGNYLPEHKFVVKDGSAMIEGNLLTNANLGIGTASFVDGPDTYRLSVEGKVRAHAVKVYTNWADFVFEEDYNLPTLEEVEAYIDQNGHLKDIPSAGEVEANGIELGEMNKLLLQKIEELTLYVIDLKKEMEALKIKN